MESVSLLSAGGFSDQEILRLRNETKGTEYIVHFNNAGASLPPDVVVDAVVSYLQEEAVTGGYEMEHKWGEKIENTYKLIAGLINADPDEIALTENASMAWGMAFNGIAFKDGDEIIASEMEYASNLLAFLQQEKSGVRVKVVPNDVHGDFDLAELEKMIGPKTKLIAITHIASSNGGMMPVNEIGRIARKHKILYLVDACQSVGHYPVDVRQMGCDVLSVTGRKYLRAPRGTGFLYVRKGIQDKIRPIFMDQHSVEWIRFDDFKLRADARRYEMFEKNRALTIGLGHAVAYTLHIGPERIWQRISFLAVRLREELRKIEGIQIHDLGSQLCGIVTFSVAGLECNVVQQKLADKRINVSTSGAAATLTFMNKHNLNSIIRASVHYYNTEKEVMTLCNALKAITAKP